MNKRPKKSQFHTEDPHAHREAEKYEHPIPSREFILETISQSGKVLSREQLAEIFNLHDEDGLEALRRRLRAMERDGQIIYTRRGFAPVDKLDLVRGRVIGHPDGFGFLQPEEGGDDLFLSARQMNAVLHGDRVVARVSGVDRRGRREGAIVEVLEHANHHVVGRYHEEGGVGFVVSDNKRISQDILIPQGQSGGANSGQFVMAEITQQPSSRCQAIGKVTEILGDHMAPGMEIDVAIRSHGIPCTWPEEVHYEIAGYTSEVPEKSKAGRLDLRETPLVTIDGEDARDFDDAVFCERKSSGWRLLVAIADVSNYVMPQTPLDAEAFERGNSVYFPERVVPMLPEILSNGLCSLNPHVDRLCMVCEMHIDTSGKVTRSRFHEAVMKSHARLTYDKVAAMLVEGDQQLREEYQHLLPHLETLFELYQVMRKGRESRGAIDFDTTETRIIFGESRKIDRIVPLVRNDAHMLIEECMIAANVCAAKFLLRNRIPSLYRIHENPNEEKVADLREFLGELGLQLKGGATPDAGQYAALLNMVRDRPDAHLIQTVMLRSLKQAQYSPDNIGHFGLAHEAYAHFTSPIRRYPDLLVHRAIRHLLRKKPVSEFDYTHDQMLTFGEHCSMTDRRADEATRDAVSWLKCEFMQDKVGDEFDGIISAVTSFGIFVELGEIFVEGLVHITELDNDYYHFDAVHHRLVGERTATVYRLGDRVRVRVARVDLDDRKIDFLLASHITLPVTEGADGGKKKKRRNKKTGKASATSDGGRKQNTSRSEKSGGKKTATRKKKRTTAVKKKQTSAAPRDKSKKKSRTKKS